ncbi:MAG: hypothetical protein ACTSUQ_10470 [Candidatus Freyarchaeota archaeon]
MGRIRLTSVLNELLQKTPIEKLPAITLDNEFPRPKRRREAVLYDFHEPSATL